MIRWIVCRRCGGEHTVDGSGFYRCRDQTLPVDDGDEVFSQPTLAEVEYQLSREVWARDEHLHRVYYG